MIDSINQVLADFLESHRPKLREELLSEAPLRNPREAPALLDDWFNNEMERLRGRPAHTSEWIASFVMSERSGGATACDIIAVVRYTREKIIEYCLSQFENVPAKLLYDAILNAETHYVDQIVRLCSEMDRQVLAAERRLQRAMAESMEQAFVLLDNGGNISFVNSPFADLVGIPEESLRGSEFAILCHPATATEIRRDLRQKRTTGARVFDGTLLDAKEATLPASFSVLPVYDDRGLRNGVAVAIRTRRAAMGNPVFTPEAIGGIADMLGMSVIVLNAQNRVTYVNASARALLDMDEKAAPQVAPEFCCTEHGADTGTCGACIARGVFAQGNTYHATVCVEDAAGGPRWLELACAAVRGPKGEISHIVRTLRNVTQQKTLENQILRQQRSSLVSQLGVTVAHQLRNPLGVMIGYAEMIHRGIPGDQVPEAVERILRNGIRCKEIVEELLEFGQGLPSEQAPCDINRLIVEKVQPMYPLSMANRITWRLQEGLPEVECVAQQIAQVFVNLIDNALWAARQSVEVRTVLQTDASGLPKYQGSGRTSMPAVCAYVTDDGPGVPEEHRRQIFDPFYTTRKDEGGIGLGLSLSRSVVQQHGGRLFLDETFTKGAQFVLQLPAEEVAEEAPGAPVSESPPASSQRRILIVDDQQDLLEMMAAALGMRGYHADMAATGSHALDLLKGATYDLAVLDVLLPGELGGPELYQIMRGANPDLAGRTMFVTGDTMNFETRQFLEQIGRPYLEKPFLVSNFVDRVEQLLAIQ